MCNYFSCIITKTFACLWLESTMSHEDIIEHYKINAKLAKLEAQDFVRLEINPIDKRNITRNKKDWIYKIDQDGALPQWFLDNQEEAEKAAWLEWQKSIKINLVIGEETIEITDKFLIACGEAKIKASGNVQVKAYDNVQVEAYDNVQVKAYDNVQVEAYDNVQVKAYDNVQVKASGNVQVKASGNVQVEASGNVATHQYSSECKIRLLSKTAVIINHITNKIIVSAEATVEVQEALKQ